MVLNHCVQKGMTRYRSRKHPIEICIFNKKKKLTNTHSQKRAENDVSLGIQCVLLDISNKCIIEL